MPADSTIEVSMKNAKEQEERYNWLEAAKSYEQALHLKKSDPSFAAKTWQKIGFCYERASRQTRSIEEFKKLRQLAAKAYEDAAEIFAKEEGLKNEGKSTECNAIATYVSSWLASDPLEKRELLDQCLILGHKSQEVFKNAGDEMSYGKIYPSLLLCFYACMHACHELESLVVTVKGMEIREWLRGPD